MKAWETGEYLVAGKQHVSALFFFHLTIEKLLKAHWIKDNVDNYPPRIHDLPQLYNQTELDLADEWYDYLGTINEWNIESRYPDYKRKIYKRADEAYMANHVEKLKALIPCLQQGL